MTKMTMAILIPTWKRPEKLKTCLEHLTNQSRTPEKIVIVCRVEDEESNIIIDQFNNTLPIKKIHVDRPGVIAAENAGLEHIDEDIICFLDDDAYAPNHWCKVIEQKLSTGEYIGVGGPDIIIQDLQYNYRRKVNRVGQLSWYGRLIGNHHHEVETESIVDVLKGVNMSFLRKHVPLLDQELQSDIREGNGSQWELDICLQMRKNGKFLFTPEIELEHDSNHSHFIPDKVAVNNARNYTYVILKNFNFIQKLVFLSYVLLIGNTNVYGLVKLIQELVSRRRLSAFKTYTLNLLGILKGIKSYLVTSMS